MTHALIIIPARHASTRLPGKPLLAETGKPLIQHTVEAAGLVPNAKVLVATDDNRIADTVRSFGGDVAMTRADHQSGTDRIAEAALDRCDDVDVVVNLQGDEPEMSPQTISDLIETHRTASRWPIPVFASTVACPFAEGVSPSDPNAVKVVMSLPDRTGVRSALYFSRANVPFVRSGEPEAYLHLGLYAFSPVSLQTFPTLTRTPYELAESLEQLRILEHGHRIAVSLTNAAPPGIDTPEDYQAFVARMAK